MELKPVPELKAPTIYDFAKTDEHRQILGFYGSTVEFGVPLAAPPGVPKDRVEALRHAHDAALRDPDLLSEIARAKIKTIPVTGEELGQRMRELAATPPEIIKKASALLGGNL
jgi:tripartite-type tricarboxylate transporter receptor subunit TctC